MPLYKTLHPDENTQVLVWKITESYLELFESIVLNDKSALRLQGMRSEMHQRGFLSVRKLLQEAGYTDFDLSYDASGKPHLVDGKFISISHSHNFATLIISSQAVGIDIEMRRDKIIRIADKFIRDEFHFLDKTSETYINMLTVIWGVKEAVFKICNEEGISFKDDIYVFPFKIEENTAKASVVLVAKKENFIVYFEEIEAFTLVYAFVA
jgi:4'-phosphopantetheinyl transferase